MIDDSKRRPEATELSPASNPLATPELSDAVDESGIGNSEVASRLPWSRSRFIKRDQPEFKLPYLTFESGYKKTDPRLNVSGKIGDESKGLPKKKL